MVHWNGRGGRKRGRLSRGRPLVLPLALGLVALVAEFGVDGLGFGGEFRREEAVFADIVRYGGEITPLSFQHARFLLGGRGTGFHAALEATDAHANNVIGIIFVDDLRRAGDVVVTIAVGAGKGRIMGGRGGVRGEDVG
jgi:hypothetical protein